MFPNPPRSPLILTHHVLLLCYNPSCSLPVPIHQILFWHKPTVFSSDVIPHIMFSSDVNPRIVFSSDVNPHIMFSLDITPYTVFSSDVNPYTVFSSDVNPHSLLTSCLLLTQLHVLSPWCNCHGWLSVKNHLSPLTNPALVSFSDRQIWFQYYLLTDRHSISVIFRLTWL